MNTQIEFGQPYHPIWKWVVVALAVVMIAWAFIVS